ncbi:hypothetical protein [Pseudoduganella sp. R-34]|uniref:hypothetical protein n=1 Tax=Pseudoduganella sp. R-34 TaxID=3404062 RepID=UPI003CF3D988
MKPIKITLTGFVGIKKGLGRDTFTFDFSSIPDEHQLVAIVGINGKGKTTILDNMHPYRLMPSRSTTLGPGGFSYWDHLCSPNAEKILDWEHAGAHYRSEFSFKLRGTTKKADYYLFQKQNGNGEWEPVQTVEGTLSDGKADTYDRCLDAILGVPERFFTSQFSAQRRRALVEYGTSEIKALLASILNLGQYRTLAANANKVGKLFQSELEGLQEQLALGRLAKESITSAKESMTALEVQAQQERARRIAIEQDLHAANLVKATLDARNESLVKEVEERTFLQRQMEQASADHRRFVAKHQQLLNETTCSHQAELVRLDDESKRINRRLEQLAQERDRAATMVDDESTVLRAIAALPEQRVALSAIESQIAASHAQVAAMRPVHNELRQLVTHRATLQTSGQAKAITIKSLQETHSLVNAVPCHGSEMQRSCPLLEHARRAGAQLVTEELEISELRKGYGSLNQQVQALEQQLASAGNVEKVIEQLTIQRKTLAEGIEKLALTASRQELIVQAKARIPEIGKELEQLQLRLREIEERRQHLKHETANAKTQADEVLRVTEVEYCSRSQTLQDRLNKLSHGISEGEFKAAVEAINSASKQLENCEKQMAAIGSTKVTLLAKIEVHTDTLMRTREIEMMANLLSDEIAKFKLLEKGLGNDGLIALSIDDAGPEISSLCNDLLQSDFDNRFTVRLDTQRETLAGDTRETFAIKVFDSRGGEPTSLDDMSGGEQVWVNECLTRAIALHVSQSNGMQYHTLFTDEADGALDPERKRQFMQMKRAVLGKGGYGREYFISQTPELWEFADHVIDVGKL